MCLVLAIDFLALLTPTWAQTAGTLDTGFNPNVGPSTYWLRPTAVQPDGKIVIGGIFTSVSGQARKAIARLNPDGTLESTATFNPGSGANGLNGEAWCAAVQTDGKILIAGYFTPSFNDQTTRKDIIRLNADGSLESTATFNPGTGVTGGTGLVDCMAVQADGKILLGGAFTSVNGQTRNNIARLNADGAVESPATFNPGTGANDYVSSVAVQVDGKILIGGSFTSVNGQARNGVARLNADGTVESTATFNPGTGVSGVISIAVQADRKILLGGYFTSVNGQTRKGIARLNADGSLEGTATFIPGTGITFGAYTAGVLSMAVQVDGRILIGGDFTSVNGQTRNRIARLNADGTLESTASFNPGSGVDTVVYGVALQADGKILLGGPFTTVNGTTHNMVARLVNDPAMQSLSIPNSSRVQWSRGGTAPEVEQVTFDLSTNGGSSWVSLGSGTRISGGWELTGLSLAGSGQVRARGRTTSGPRNGTSGLVEMAAAFSPPEIVVEQPAGTNLTDGVNTVGFGTLLTGTNASLTFTIKNTGGFDLTGLGITIDGANPSDFSVIASPTAPVPGPTGSTTFTVRFAPITAGAKTAALHIASNDADENPFDIALTGQALLDSDGDGVSDYDELYVYGTNPYLADTDGDGMPDAWEIAHGLNPRVNDANDDADLDGLTNLEEYLAGTDPQARYTNGATVSDYERIKGERRRFATYDSNDRLIGVQYTNGVAFAFIYDGNSNLVRQTLEDADADHDGLPDVWEVAYGLSTSSGTGDDGPWGDPDHDGWTNYQEWKAGTNPRDPNSHPHLLTTPAALLRQTPTLARLLPAASTLGALPTLNVKLWDGEGNSAKVFVQYFDPVTQQWKDATVTKLDGSLYSGTVGVSAAPAGASHTLVWNAYADLGYSFSGNATLRVRADDVASTGQWSEPFVASVNMSRDSNGDGVPDNWAMFYGLDPNGLSAAQADADRDGVNDFLEYALNTNPRVANATGLPTAGQDAGRHLTLTFTRRKDAPQLQYVVEVSDDLQTWHSGTGYVEQVSAVDQGVTEQVTVRTTAAIGAGRCFMRVRVTPQ